VKKSLNSQLVVDSVKATLYVVVLAGFACVAGAQNAPTPPASDPAPSSQTTPQSADPAAPTTPNSDPASPSEERKPEPPAPQPTPPATPEPAAAPPVALPEVAGSLGRRVPQPGDDVVVVMKDGQRLEGSLVAQDEAQYTVRIAAVDARFFRSDVERIFVQDTPRERYKRMRAMIAADDTERLVLLVQWLQSNRLYDEGLTEVNHVLAVDPNNGEAIRLKAVLLELKALDKRSAGGRDPEQDARTREVARDFPTRNTPVAFPFLSDEQVNLIKVFELDLNDPPRIVIPRAAVERMLREYADHPLVPSTREGREAFLAMPAEKVLDVMFRLRAREYYNEVKVPDQPNSMKLFRDHVHAAWLVNNCATTRCHGGSAAGRLQLTNFRPTSEPSIYTNFLILERFRTRDGLPLIDYENPDRSVLLEMALPREEARNPHPAVPGWTPVFRTRENRRFKQAVEWISAMYRPRPSYPIEYIPPGERPPEPGPNGEPVIPPADGPVER
jgi:hypothetical protein